MNAEVKYMNVWRSKNHDRQWTDGEGGLGDRDFVDAVAKDIARLRIGIYRLGVLRVKMKVLP